MLRRMLRDKSGEGYILTAIRFVLVAAALLLVVCMMSIGIRAVYMDAAADQIRDSIAASSSTTDRNTRDTIEKWQDKIYFYAEFDADEWVDLAEATVIGAPLYVYYTPQTPVCQVANGDFFNKERKIYYEKH